jgi:hypothetical protein
MPYMKPCRVMVGTSVRKPFSVLAAHLESVLGQILPPNTELKFCYVKDWPEPPQDKADTLLDTALPQDRTTLLQGVGGNDFQDTGGTTHQWTPTAINRVALNKNRIIQQFLASDCDYLWFCDADLLLDPMTLWSMLSTDKMAVCAVYWTRWHKGMPDRKNAAMPQVWLRHPYDMTGHGYVDPGEFWGELIARRLTQVWGQGACTLLQRKVLEAGVTFDAHPDVPGQGGMSMGEDRHFCFRLTQKNIQMYADPWPDILHLYHLPDDLQRVPATAMRHDWVRTMNPACYTPGDLCSLTLEMVEPLLNNGEAYLPPKQYVRGRIPEMRLMPELEEAVYDMRRGQARLVEVHFPSHYPFLPYRNTRRLVRVTLVDRKPYQFPPILEEDLWVGPHSGSVVDLPSFDPATQSLFQESHHDDALQPRPESGRQGTPDDASGPEGPDGVVVEGPADAAGLGIPTEGL